MERFYPRDFIRKILSEKSFKKLKKFCKIALRFDDLLVIEYRRRKNRLILQKWGGKTCEKAELFIEIDFGV